MDVKKGGGKALSGATTAMFEEIKGGETNKRKLFETYGAAYGRIYKGVSHCIDLVKVPKKFERRPPLEVTVWFGKSGHGKTYQCEETMLACELSSAKLASEQLRHPWYDMYDGEQVLWLDDFRGCDMKPHHLIQLMNNQEKLPIKGGFRENVAQYLFITTPDHPRTWWKNWYKEPNNVEQIRRRIKTVFHCEKVGEEYTISNVTDANWEEYKGEAEIEEGTSYKPKFTN